MPENETPATETTPQGDSKTNPLAEPTAPPEESSGRYAAYDTTYLRFVGGVHDTKKAAAEAAKASGSKRYKIREV